MHNIKRLSLPICLVLLGIGILLLGAWDMQRAQAARPDAWYQVTELQQPVAYYGSAHCPDDPDSFYVVAGWQSWFVNQDEVWRYDVDSDTLTQLASYPEPMGVASVTCYQGYLYAAGGSLGDDTSWHFYRYEIAMDRWTQLSDLPRQQNGATLAAWDGYLFMIGGVAEATIPIDPTTQVDRYNLQTDTWEMNWGTPMPVATVGDGLQAGKYVYIVGGFTSNFPQNSDATLRYDLTTGTWQVGPSFTSRRALMALDITSQYLYAIGGDANYGSTDDETDLVERLDLSAWPAGNWVDISDPLPAPREANQGFCSEVLTGGEIWSVGGVDALENTTTEIYYRPSEPCADFSFGDLTREDWGLGNQPGESAHYVLPLVNNGTQVDTYDVSVSSTWVITAPSTIGPLAPGATDLLMVDVLVPADADPGDFDVAQISVTSQGDPEAVDDAQLTTSVTDWHEVTPVPINVAFQERAQCADDRNGFYILGGSTPDLYAIDSIYYYNAITDEWLYEAALPSGGGWGHITTCYDQKLYVIGSGFSNTVFEYDLANHTWKFLDYAPRSPYGFGLGVWDGQLFMVGGTDEVNIYNITADAWSLGPNMPVDPAPFGFGYVQAGQYLYVVGGMITDWVNWNGNQAITLRLDMVNLTWEFGPSFDSRRALTGLGVTQSHLYAIGGDVNGGERLDPTGMVEVLDLSQWPNGEWVDIEQPLPWALEANWGGVCTEAKTGGEVWSVGGASGTWANRITIHDAYYLPVGEPCVQNIVNLSDSPMVGEGEIGQIAEYQLSITNTGNITDYFNLDWVSTWPVGLATGGPLPIGPGESVQVVVGVEVPLDVHVGDQGTTVLTVYSLRDPKIMDTIQLTTTVIGNDIHLDPDSMALEGLYGETLTFTLTVSNQGDITDTVSLTYTGNTWEVVLPVTSLELGVGDTAKVIVNVTIPPDVWLGDSDDLVLTASSQGNPMVIDDATLTATAFWYRTLLPLGMKN